MSLRCFCALAHPCFLLLCLRLSVGHAPLTHPESPVTIRQYLKQLSKHKNFMWFVSMNLVQVRFINNMFLQIKVSAQVNDLVVSAPPAGVSLPFQQQLLPSFPGAPAVRQYFCLHRFNLTR